jgi:hypothetical protein
MSNSDGIQGLEELPHNPRDSAWQNRPLHRLAGNALKAERTIKDISLGDAGPSLVDNVSDNSAAPESWDVQT